MPGADRPVVVIGAGVAGLTAACALAHRGVETVVLEKNAVAGGCNSQRSLGGYRFDIGATMLQTPEVIAEAFESFGESLDDHVDLIPLDPLYRLAFPDGRALDMSPSVERTAAAIAAFSPSDALGFERYMRDMDESKRALKRLMIDRDVRATDALRLFRAFNPLRSVASLAQRYFHTREVRTAFTFQVLYWGVPPSRCPAVFGMIPFFEISKGVWHVRGGLHSISAALTRILAKNGGSIRLGTPVERIEVSAGKAKAVCLQDGERIEATAVLSGADALYTYRDLIPDRSLSALARARLARVSPSASARVALLGLKGPTPLEGIPHHTFLMPSDIDGLCRRIFEQHLPPPDSYAYLCTPTKTDASMAPPGRTALYALALVPRRLRGALEEHRDGVVERLLTELRRRGLTNDSTELDLVRVMLPSDFERDFNQPAGAFGMRSTLRQIGPLRFGTRSRGVARLYLAGASANPGAGLPLVTASGRAAAEAVLEDLGHLSGDGSLARVAA